MKAAKGGSQNLCVAEQRIWQVAQQALLLSAVRLLFFFVLVGGQLWQKGQETPVITFSQHPFAAHKGATNEKYIMWMVIYVNLKYFSSCDSTMRCYKLSFKFECQ